MVAVPHGDLAPARGEGAGGALPVHEDVAAVAVHVVPLHLRDVVRHVVDDVHAHVLGGPAEHLLEGPPRPVGDHLPVGPGVVGPAAHGAVVALAEPRRERRAGELPVRQVDGVRPEEDLHLPQVFGGDLMPAAAGAAVYGDGDRARLQAVGFGGALVEHLVNHVELQEVVSGAEGPQLPSAALARPLAHPLLVGVGHAAALLGDLEVALPAVAVLDAPLGTEFQHVRELPVVEPDEPLGPETRGDVPVEAVHERPHPIPDIAEGEVGPDEADAAVDVEAYPAGRDRALVGVDGGHAADGEAVSPMYVRHRHGVADDPRQGGDVRRLLRGVVAEDGPDERIAGVDDGVGPHPRKLVPRDHPPVAVYPLEPAVPRHRMPPRGRRYPEGGGWDASPIQREGPRPRFEPESRDPQSPRITKLPHLSHFVDGPSARRR